MCPDVLVLDLAMPGLPGLEVIRRVASGSPATKVVVLSMHADELYAVKALSNGAVGYVVKDAGAAELMNAIRAAVAGRGYLSSPIREQVVKAHGTGRRPRCSTLMRPSRTASARSYIWWLLA